MLAKSALFRMCAYMLLATVVCAMTGALGLAQITACVCVFMFCLYFSTKEDFPDARIKDMFESNVVVREVGKAIQENPELHRTVIYLANLEPYDFVRTVQLSIEIREGHHQEALKAASGHYRKGDQS